MSNKREQKPKTIGKSTNSRGTWNIDPRTRIKPGKKGKGASYKRRPKHTNRGDY